jgi:hypothetical protein
MRYADLRLFPISLVEANAFIARHHRHHQPVVGHKFSLACWVDDKLVGVVTVGRPVAKSYDDLTLEVNRLCSDGTPNVPSFLYAAAWRTAKAMGYHRVITYTLDEESGTSLRAVGWTHTHHFWRFLELRCSSATRQSTNLS